MSRARLTLSPRRSRLTVLAAAALLALTVASPAVADTQPDDPPIAPDEQLDTYEPVAWYEENRVHAHTRFQVRQHWSDGVGTEAFDNAGSLMSELGANVYVRHVHTTDEDPWWPSAAPLGPDGERLFDDDRLNEMTCTSCEGGVDEIPVPAGTDLPAEFIAEAESSGVGLIAYYYQYHNRRVANEHPEWVCTGFDGEPNSGPRGPILDWTSGYRDIVRTHLVELAERGVQAFYHDYQVDPPGGCRTPSGDAAFTAATGLEPPERRDNRDPVYHAWIDFRTQQRIEAFQEWRAAIREVQPNAVMIVSVTNMPTLTVRESSLTEWANGVDAIKTEYHHAIRQGGNGSVFVNNPGLAQPDNDVQMSLGWALMRDLTDLSPHIWGNQLPNTEHVYGFVGSLAAHGNIANLDVRERHLAGDPEAPGTPLEALEAGFALGNQISPYLANTEAERWAAVHYSEAQRNDRMMAAPTGNAALVNAWTEVLWPTTGAYGVLAREGVPTTVVTDQQLTAEGLEGLRLLVLPHRDELDADQAAAVNAWEADGGVVIENDPSWQWADPAQTDAAEAAFAAAVAPHLPDAQVHVTGGPEAMYATAFTPKETIETGNPLTIAISNDFSWVQLRGPEGDPPNPAAPAATGVQVEFDASLLGCTSPDACAEPHIFDAVTDQTLEYELTETGYRVQVPSFDHLAVIAVEQAPSCDDTIEGTHRGPLNVTSGVTCLTGATVTGPMTIGEGSSLVVTDSTLRGPLQAASAATVLIQDSSLRGPLTVTRTTENVRIIGNELHGPVSITGNQSLRTVIADNDVRGPLTCRDNAPPPTTGGWPNSVTGRSQGQCAA